MPVEKKIKYQTLALMISIITIFGVFFLYQVNQYVDNKLQKTLKYKKEFEVKLFNETLKHHTEMYTRRLDKLLGDKDIIDAFSSQNRELLYTKTIPAFKQFQKENSYIKIFTFRLADGTTFLRVHKPEMFGDTLNKKRKIIIDTNMDKTKKFGFEIGKLKMTYRIVTPIFDNKKYLGCVELGIEPEGFMQILTHIIPLQYALVIHENKNNKFILAKPDQFFQNLLKKISLYERSLIKIGKKEFEVDANMILYDHTKKVQAYFITVGDITNEINQASNLKKILATTILASMILLILLLNYSINIYIKNIKKMFYTDELTGLANRYALLEDLKSRTKSSKLFLININSFKNINELYGVQSGNDVLKQMGEIISKIAKLYNMKAFRISSDEFILFAKNLNRRLDIYILQEIYIAIKEQHFILNDLDILVDIDISIGAADGIDVSLEKVNMALKNARIKHIEYSLYTKDIDTKKDTKKIIQVKREIRYALENQNIVPYYQPIVDRDGKVIKYEALMRMIKLNGGKEEIIYPAYFLELSFKFNLYAKLSKTVIKQVFDAINHTDKLISLNLAPSDILDNTMSSYVLDKLNTCKRSQQIVVEITESEDITDFNIIKRFILKVKKTGAKIAIDDFGSGYANYTHIFELKPDYIKIDGSLIKDITTNKENQIFVKTIINMSKELGIKVIAEYVHSKEVFELSKSYGVDEFQGFYFGQAQKEI